MAQPAFGPYPTAYDPRGLKQTRNGLETTGQRALFMSAPPGVRGGSGGGVASDAGFEHRPAVSVPGAALVEAADEETLPSRIGVP